MSGKIAQLMSTVYWGIKKYFPGICFRRDLRSWEFVSKREMLRKLVGNDFGPRPEKRISEIREFKKGCADFIATQTGMVKSHVVLEVGSGCGFVSCHIAPRVKQLYCCDVSKRYLRFARKECKGIGNIFFKKVSPVVSDFDFLEKDSIDVAFASNVFIHLNLFDVYWYFHAFKRVVKPGGVVWFDIASAEKEDFHAEQYFK